MRSIDAALRRYVAAVSVGGTVLFGGFALRGDPDFPHAPGTAFWVLAVLVLLGEFALVPFLSRRGGASGATTSAAFAFAILLGWGLPTALIVQVVASLVADALQRKAWFKVVFNAAQYTLSMAAAGLVIEVLVGRAPLIQDGHVGGQEVAVLVTAGAAWFVVNNVLTGIVVALAQNARVLPHIIEEVRVQTVIDPILIALAPVFVIVAQTTPAALPLLVLPVVGVYFSAKVTVEKEHEALHDSLTGLPNRASLRSRLGDAIAKAAPGEKVAVLLVDLDRFKEVNDTLGHATGDRMLQTLGPLLEAQVRAGDVIARLGGDEFAAFLPHVEGDEAAVEVARRIRGAITQPFVIEGVPLFIEASVGIAIYPDDGEDVGTLLRRADVAMYLAKETHAGYERYSPERDRHSVSRLTMLGELRSGIDLGELVLHYQPKADAASGDIAGVEALVRWRHPTRGLLYPADFLLVAERSGLILDLTDRVLEQGVAQALAWERDGIRVPVAANLSVRSLDDEQLPQRITGLLQRMGARPESLGLEITESTVMADPAGARRVLAPLSEMGVRIAIDDFGTGYSSLAYLTQLPISEIKIDKSFMTNILDNASDAIVVRSTIALAHDLGLEVVAEGVESAAVCELLAEYGCDLIQGFYVHRPVPGVEFTSWFRSLADATGGAGFW
jgi:diguanylate cyclase (GGDEF)-like protein